MSIFSSLFGDNSTTTSQQTQLAPVAAGAATDLFNKATAYANQPWSALPDADRIAQFNADQQSAFNSTRNIGENSGNLFSLLQNRVLGDQNSGSLDSLKTTFDQANLSGYMNPYTQAVLDPALEDIARRSAITQNNLNATSARTGSFGGSRNALANMELERNTMGEMGRLSANERARAFNEAANQFRTDQQVLPALQQRDYQNLSMLGTQNAARLGTEVNPLLATGGLQQGLEQAQRDVINANYLEARDWGSRGINALMQALGTGGSLGSTSRSTTEGPRPNAIGQVIGAGTGLLGSLGGLSGIGGAISSGWDWLTGSGGGGGDLSGAGGWLDFGGSGDLGGFGTSLFAKGGLVGLEK